MTTLQPNPTVLDHPTLRIPDDTIQCNTEFDAPPLQYVCNDPNESQRLLVIEMSGTLDFWNEPEEDIYNDANS